MLAAQAGIKRANLATEESWLGRYSLLWLLVEKNLALMGVEHGEPDLLDLDADELGGNFRRNLIALVEDARELGAHDIVLATFSIHLRDGMTIEQQEKAMASARYYMPYMSKKSLLAGFERYNAIIREVAAETGAILVEGEYDIPGDPLHFNDSVHFTDEGSKRQAARVIEALLASPDFLQTAEKFRR